MEAKLHGLVCYCRVANEQQVTYTDFLKATEYFSEKHTYKSLFRLAKQIKLEKVKLIPRQSQDSLFN